MVSVGNRFHTNIILSLKLEMLTALCEWDNKGVHPPKVMIHFPPSGFRFPLFPDLFLSPWENFPNFTLPLFREKINIPLFSQIFPCFRSIGVSLPDLRLFSSSLIWLWCIYASYNRPTHTGRPWGSGVQRGCGGCDGPGHPAWGIQRPSFRKISVGKCLKMLKKKIEKVMTLRIHDIGGHTKEGCQIFFWVND